MKINNHRKLCIILAITFFWSLIFVFLYHTDNKYTAALPAVQGKNKLDAESVSMPHFLVDGWEYYPGKLLQPEDYILTQAFPEIIYLGQYSNFTPALGTPYGVATYRLILETPSDNLTLGLYLPEVPSACKVYINGNPVETVGSVSPYMPLIKETLLSFESREQCEIIVQTANYNHYYSGLYYPPAVGSLSCLSKMIILRTIIYGFLCFSSLAVAFSNLAFWVLGKSGKDSSALWFGILCLAFSLRICYPFLRMTGVPSIGFLYAVEDFMGGMILLSAACLTVRLCNLSAQRVYRHPIFPACIFFVAFSTFFPLFILPYTPSLINEYGIAVSMCKLLLSFWLAGICLFGFLHQNANRCLMLTGTLLFHISQIFSILTINRFEPIYGAWWEEYGAFAMVITFAILMVRRNLRLTEENFRLTQHLQEEVNQKTSALTAVVEERRELLAQLVHDFKAPVTSIRNYTTLIQNQNVELDEETLGYLNALQNRMDTLDYRFHLLHQFSSENSSMGSHTQLCLNTLVEEFYACNRPDIELNGQTFQLKLPSNSLIINGDREGLWRVLENLCYNALSFIPEDGKVILSLKQEDNTAKISVSDNGCGIPPENLTHIFESGFTKRNNLTGEGLGLFIVHSIILEHGGKIHVDSVPEKGTTFTITLPLL